MWLAKDYFFRYSMKLLISVVLLLSALTLRAQTADDKVVIANQSDVFTFIEKKGQTMVRHEVKTEYELKGKLAQDIHPSISYDDDWIILNHASCGDNKAQHINITSEGVFYDGTKMCFFEATLTPRKPKRTAYFVRTISDVRCFSRVDLANNTYFIRKRTVSFVFPKGTEKYRLMPWNQNGSMQVDTAYTKAETIITYTLHNVNAQKDETCMPPHALIMPNILILGAFSDYRDLNRWLQNYIEVNTTIPNLDAVLNEIGRDCQTEEDRLRNTYQWVQRNIRYVAFEAGNDGYQPDCPAEVLRKRYGDCKGMAMLLRTLLRAQGFDAHFTHIASTDIPYRVSKIPSLCTFNHAICTVFFQGQTYFLDATCRYVPLGYISQSIQGQEAMIGNGDDCQLLSVPMLPASSSTDSLCYEYELGANHHLIGRSTYSLSGDMREAYLRSLEEKTKENRQYLLANSLNNDSHRYKVSEVTFTEDSPNHEWTIISGKIDNGVAVQSLGSELYLELNPHNICGVFKIDTLKRVNDVWLPLRNHVVREVKLHLPHDFIVSYLPEGIEVPLSQGYLSCTFLQKGDTIVYRQCVHIDRREIPHKKMSEWNKAVDRWIAVCNEQIILKRKEE